MSEDMKRQPINLVVVRTAARELYRHHGEMALNIARERAERLQREHDFPVLDAALLLLNEVERLVGRPPLLRRFQYPQPH